MNFGYTTMEQVTANANLRYKATAVELFKSFEKALELFYSLAEAMKNVSTFGKKMYADLSDWSLKKILRNETD